jgi:hypothetical protein
VQSVAVGLTIITKSHIKKHNLDRPQWLRERQRAQKSLEVLDEKLENGVMTDERYKERAAIHTETLARTNQLLNAANTDAESWLELAKETFSIITNIGDVFQMANDEERRRLMMYVGSNWYLTNKKWLSHRGNHLICCVTTTQKRFGGPDRI